MAQGMRYMRRQGSTQVVAYNALLFKRKDFYEIPAAEAEELMRRNLQAQHSNAALVLAEKQNEAKPMGTVDPSDGAAVFAAGAGIDFDKADANTLLAFAAKQNIQVSRSMSKVETIRKHIREAIKDQMAGRDQPQAVDESAPPVPAAVRNLAQPGGADIRDATPEELAAP